MWIATADGLNLFDGYQVRTFEHEFGDPTSIPSPYARVVTHDESGSMWVGTLDGLARLDPSTNDFETFTAESGLLPGDNITALKTLPGGEVWVGTTNGLALLNPETRSSQIYMADSTRPGGLPNPYISALETDAEGSLWVGTFHGAWSAKLWGRRPLSTSR